MCWPSSGEDKPFIVDGPPAVTAGSTDGPPLFVGGGFDKDGLTVADAVGEEFPETVADSSAGVADEDSGVDFDHPAGEVAA